MEKKQKKEPKKKSVVFVAPAKSSSCKPPKSKSEAELLKVVKEGVSYMADKYKDVFIKLGNHD